jgi:hypothetical protein
LKAKAKFLTPAQFRDVCNELQPTKLVEAKLEYGDDRVTIVIDGCYIVSVDRDGTVYRPCGLPSGDTWMQVGKDGRMKDRS